MKTISIISIWIILIKIQFLSSNETISLDGLGLESLDSTTFISGPLPVSTIILSSNFLSFLPEDIFSPFYSTLNQLSLRRNRFSSLENSSFLLELHQLETFDLSENQLEQISSANFLGLIRLKTLILRKNHLTSLISSSFESCRTMTTLDLSNNRISSIDRNAFRLLDQLEILLLSNNPLGQSLFDVDLLRPLVNLQSIDLENTQLNDLPAFFFVYNENLRSIQLRRNDFNASINVLKQTFCAVRSLIEIDFVSTNLRSLDICTYDQVPSLRRLYLMDNPLDCTCELFYLQYGNIHRILLQNLNGIDEENSNIDKYLHRWITRPELRRHLEIAFAHGAFSRLPIELSMFTRCASPAEWSGYEVMNITGIYSRCHQRWIEIEDECHNYCQIDHRNRSNSNVVQWTVFLFFFFVIN